MTGYARKKKKRKNHLAMLAITVVVLALVAVLGYQTAQLGRKNEDYEARLAAVEAELEQESARALSLEEQRIYVQTKQYIEEQAKIKLGLVNPDEILLKPSGN